MFIIHTVAQEVWNSYLNDNTFRWLICTQQNLQTLWIQREDVATVILLLVIYINK